MNTILSLGQQIVSSNLRVNTLLNNAQLVGGIYTMGYEECLVLTNDLWKRAAGGIPQHCFLLATALPPGDTSGDVEDEEVILLRVVGPAPLPAEAELVAVRAEAMREIVTSSNAQVAATPAAILDVLTRNEIQFSGIRTKILGTFFESEIVTDGGSKTSFLAFGSDIETFYSASRYKVYKPYGQSLAIIASYPEITATEARQQHQPGHQPSRVRIGTVRYTSSTARLQRNANSEMSTTVPVKVNIEDFIAMKTAVFGMTRLGKSNTMKILATAIFQHAHETGKKIGQLLFDPAGEYANVNVQDRTALSQIGAEHVTIFRFGATGNEEGVRSLSTNFFNDATIDVTWSIIQASLSLDTAGYVKSFLSANVIGPADPADDQSAWRRSRRRRAALYATLLKANFTPPKNFRCHFAANKDVVAAVNAVLKRRNKDTVESDDRGTLHLNASQLRDWMDALFEARTATTFPADWIDSEMDAILAVLSGSVGLGYRKLEPLRAFHSPDVDKDYANAVLEELVLGKIVIVDLSRGGEAALKFISERIVNHIVSDAAHRFATGQEPHNLQIYLEEAHRLFNRDRFLRASESDPYVRLAKEAAKFKIGLVYATQEVTSVDPVILSNTSNWVVTHLNNHIEVKELSKYYDFQDFAELTLKAEDVGFVRLKSRSGRYIVPVQIDLFDETRIATARQAAASAGR